VTRWIWVGVAVIAAGVLCIGSPAIVLSAALLSSDNLKPAVEKGSSCGAKTVQTGAHTSGTVKVTGFNATQVGNAAVIVQVGQQMNVPPRGWVIAVATAMQESNLHNLGHLGDRNDHDSQGLFQQRPSQGWGTVQQIRDPKHASRKFYEKLLQVPGWQSLPLTVAAQRVQVSAYPNAYAKHETGAGRLVDAITDGGARTPVTAVAAGRCANPDEVTAGGWVRPVSAPIWSGFRTSDRPDHDGVDIGAKRGAPIKVVTGGTVIHLECDRQRDDGYDCDRDGSPSQLGCGWYMDVKHPGNFVTRYCHMLRHPATDGRQLKVGDTVKVGQQIGLVGNSGHSSAPHLHFEVHERGGRDNATAVDPVKFMRDRGAPLGGGQDA
jgi:murein DD-endopeptidase MepM/ murein hydrolase activator NlpD